MISLCPPKQARTPTSLALGSFDGLHSGHRRVIAEAVKQAPGLPTVVSFWPHPREVLYNEPRMRLDLPGEKLALLDSLGVDQLVMVPFDYRLAALTAAEFFDQILHSTLQARRIVVGANFRFGRGREGSSETLCELGRRMGIEVKVVPIQEVSGDRISSSRIREALHRAQLARAAKLLGRSYCFSGRVVRGRGLGQEIGWPTANLLVDGRKFLPALGVYAAWAKLTSPDSPRYDAVMNLGSQPTVDPASPSAVEVHLLDRELTLDGRELMVEPVLRIRSQQRFASLEELSARISYDAELARRYLARTTTPQDSVNSGIGISQTPYDEGANTA